MVTNNIVVTDNTNNASISKGMIAGFSASAVSALYMIIATAIAIVPDFYVVNVQGNIFGLAENIAAAWALYFIIGTFVWGILYPLIETYLPGKTQTRKGLAYGILIWILVMMVIMPLGGAGFFATRYGMAAVIAVLTMDLIFGAALGYTYGRLTNRINK